MSDAKIFISANDLLADSFRLGMQVLDSGFRPTHLVGIWRGGAPVGIAVQELLDYHGQHCDHIAIRTSSYHGIDKQDAHVKVFALGYLIDTLNPEDRLLIIDDVFDSGRSIRAFLAELKGRCRHNMPRDIRIATVWYKPGRNVTDLKPDFFVHETERWLIFPHEVDGLTIEEIRQHKPEAAIILREEGPAKKERTMSNGFASSEARAAFIAGLPKAELHLHIEGSLEPELMFALAQRNAVAIPFASVEEVRAAYAFSNLQDFLDIYYQGMGVLHTERDFYDLTAAYLARARADAVRHVEIFFDPQGHTTRGIAFGTVIAGITRALDEARASYGLSSRLIMCFLRHLSEAEAEATLDEAMPYLDRIDGVGLDSSEVGHPPAKFERVFARARALGLKIVAHAGEEGPPAYVREALDLLQVDRIDHGNRSLEDPALVARLAAEGITLTVCPLSNLKLCVVGDLADHPLKTMLDAGLRATVNSDDPSYFGGYVNANYRAVADALDLSKADLVALARNSVAGSFLDEADKAKHLAAIDAYA